MQFRYFGYLLALAPLFIGASTSVPVGEDLVTRTLTKRALPDFTKWNLNLGKGQQDRDRALLGVLHAVFMARVVYMFKDDPLWAPVFDSYFNPGDRPAVEQIFKSIANVNDTHPDGDVWGSDHLAGISVINFPSEQGAMCEEDPNRLASLENVIVGRGFQIVLRICDRAFEFPDLATNKTGCDAIGPNVSGKMSSIAGIVLHEFMHYSPLAGPAVGSIIDDYGGPVRKDRHAGYGPMITRTLKSANPLANADNYRWFAQELWWTALCGKAFGAPTDNKDFVDCDGDTSCVLL